MRSKTGKRPSFGSSDSAITKGAVFKNIKNADISHINTINTSSFRYDPAGTGIKSTQEIPVDYSDFANHVFFNSARSKVDVAFDTIINNFPYDSKRSEIEDFLDGLTGFERYVYDSFPKNVGYLNFSGSTQTLPAEGTYIMLMTQSQLIFRN